MIKKFNEFINENDDSYINWEEIEEVCANSKGLPDSIPTNIRQWDVLIKQYERASDLVNGKWEPHYNWETEEEFHQAVNEQFYLGKGYKNSIYECYEDLRAIISKLGKKNLFKNVDWDIIYNAIEFTKWSIILWHEELTELPLLPQKVGGSVSIEENNLTSLKGSPKYVGGDFFCFNNKLTSLKGAPNYVGGIFYCGTNNFPKKSIPREFPGKDLHKYIDL